MTDTYKNDWEKFEHSGRIDDYLAYKGINCKSFSGIKGEHINDNHKGNSDFLQKCQ
ncbi:MAG: hypothetical protein ACI4J5_00105 [Oscillospiraceae bacterium]